MLRRSPISPVWRPSRSTGRAQRGGHHLRRSTTLVTAVGVDDSDDLPAVAFAQSDAIRISDPGSVVVGL